MTAVDHPTIHWFSREGCVVREADRRILVIGHQQVASWKLGERGVRNTMMVQLAEAPSVILEDLAKAFEVSSETLRLQRRLCQAEGLEAVLKRGEYHGEGGKALGSALRRRMEQLFARGKTDAQVKAELKGPVHASTVAKYRKRWEEKRAKEPSSAEQLGLQLEGPTVATAASSSVVTVEPKSATEQAPEVVTPAPEPAPQACERSPAAEAAASSDQSGAPPIRAPTVASERAARISSTAKPTASEDQGKFLPVSEFAPFSAKGVQHLGVWLLLGTVAKLGLYSILQQHEERRTTGRPLRVAIDAVLAGLAMGGCAVESVRRLATSSVAAMLLADTAPSATWVRRTLGGYCQKQVSEKVLDDFSGNLLREARESTAEGEPVVLFIDNHGRQYTGMHLLGRIWRMQDKRTVAGAMDFWVHDGTGRPLMVIKAEPNTSLPEAIRSRVAYLQEMLGPENQSLMAFDRAGAFPGLWKFLRDQEQEFVTYQRAKFRKYRRAWFERHGRSMTLHEADGTPIKVKVQTGRMNLKKDRGRVQRIRLLMPDDSQLNIVASSTRPVKWICQQLFRRWRQENGLRHGVERWGINQLDGRTVEAVPDGTLVTNPHRVNLDHLLRDDRQREKQLLLQLQQLYPGHPQRPEVKKALAANRATQRQILEARSQLPKKLPVEQTELHGELKQHTREYKLLVDILRCAGQFAEAQLATILAKHMRRPDEAKRLLENVFCSPGDIRVTSKSITVVLAPAANKPERLALEAFFEELDRHKLCHPGDPLARPLRFRLQRP